MFPHRVLSLSILALSTLACSRESRDAREGAASAAATTSASASVADVAAETSGSASGRGAPNFTEGPDGEVWMATRRGTLLMRLRHDSVLIGFSDSLRQAVKGEVDSSMHADAEGEASGLGRAVRGAVEATVKTTLREVFEKQRGFPVSDLRGVRYEDGAIVFDYVRKPLIAPEDIKDGDLSMLAQFHPADAARFVGAVRGRMDAR